MLPDLSEFAAEWPLVVGTLGFATFRDNRGKTCRPSLIQFFQESGASWFF